MSHKRVKISPWTMHPRSLIHPTPTGCHHPPPPALTCTQSDMYIDVVAPMAPLNMRTSEVLNMERSTAVSLLGNSVGMKV